MYVYNMLKYMDYNNDPLLLSYVVYIIKITWPYHLRIWIIARAHSKGVLWTLVNWS